jgi:septal ring factor EnvC (AmiA/AmiB activator)
MSRKLFLLTRFLPLFLVLIANPVFASPDEELKKTQEKINEEKLRSKKLEYEDKRLAEKYAKLTAQMVKTATSLQSSEARLSAIEEKLRILSEQISEKTESLTARKKDLAVMVQAAIKLSQTPKEAVILMPGDMMNNMKASRALKMTSDSIKYQAQSIREQMKELEKLKEKVTKNQEEAVAERVKLEEQRALLKVQIAEHNAMRQKLTIEQKAAKARIQQLAKKAEDLQDLIVALEKEKVQQKEEEITTDTSQPEGEKGELRSFKAAKGKVRVPAAGKLTERFGVEGHNETSKGITITTRLGAQVTAPYDAEVLFTGPFMEYGKMIILRHSDGFHTLLAGMAKIDTSVGEFLLEGEPIGAMGDKEPNNQLYMELRSNNHPIDPSPWIRGMNKQ